MDTLATLLRAHGYRTGAFVSAFPLDSRFGLDAGFEVYDDRLGDPDRTPDFRMQERPGPQTVAAARAWLDATPAPRFCWVHLYEPHAPYAPPYEWRGRVPSAYDGEVAAADDALAPLLDPLLARGRSGRTLVVLTADHGEGLGEHGEATHGLFAYESTLRVPLLLYAPRLFRPRVVAEGARHVDILPTVLDALGLPVPPGLPGRSLLAAAEGRRAGSAPPSYFEALTPALTRGWAPIHGVLRDRVKYVDLPLPELYDLAADPDEAANLVARAPASLDGMRALLARLREADHGVERVAEDPAARERLASLGYASASRGLAARYREEDDPKRHLAFEEGLRQVVESDEAGDVAGALARCERLVREWPAVPLALRHLAVLRRRAGDLAGAVEAARRALAADPGSTDAAVELGRALNDLGRPREAAAILGPCAGAEDADLDLLMTWGIALARSGERDEAEAALERARRSDPQSALAAYNLGAVHLLFSERDEARRALTEALALEPGMARALNSLGLLAAEEGRPEEAVRLFSRALAADPDDPDTLYNLGAVLWREGRRTEARAHLERFLAAAPTALYAPDRARVRSWLARRG
jgi:tetratricopeptide (TPR) repeat protein